MVCGRSALCTMPARATCCRDPSKGRIGQSRSIRGASRASAGADGPRAERVMYQTEGDCGAAVWAYQAQPGRAAIPAAWVEKVTDGVDDDLHRREHRGFC